MSRRVVFVLALLVPALAPRAHATEPMPHRVRESIAQFAPRLELTELFARFADAGVPRETEDGVNMTGGAVEVLVARIGTDGKPVMVCVDSEQAARRFLDAPIERVMRPRSQQQ